MNVAGRQPTSHPSYTRSQSVRWVHLDGSVQHFRRVNLVTGPPSGRLLGKQSAQGALQALAAHVNGNRQVKDVSSSAWSRSPCNEEITQQIVQNRRSESHTSV
eukprot:346289-Chlamydomonas_euryale.AAC.5